MRIYLTGFMGSGKSHLGRELASRLGLAFADLDQLIEAEAGQRITDLFAKEGERGFRERERRALHLTTEMAAAVIATGGGTPCFFDNMQWMNQNGLTVFLDIPVPVLVSRLHREMEHRPLLHGLSPEELSDYIAGKLDHRRPFYEKARFIYRPQSEEDDAVAYLLQILTPLI